MLAALDRVRRDLAALGADDVTAPEVPAEVTVRVGAALQAEPPRRTPGGTGTFGSTHPAMAAGRTRGRCRGRGRGRCRRRLEYPHYTRPAEFSGWEVPDVLLSGNHARIDGWRAEQSRSRSTA